DQQVEHPHVVELAVGDVQERRDIAAQIEQRVQLDRGLGPLVRRPREQRQTQVDVGGIERVDALADLYAEWLVGIELPRQADQALGKVGVDAPAAYCVGIGQRVARDAAA